MSRAVTLANFASGEAITVDETNDRVGIASTTPDATLDIKNTILMDGDAGIITATTFKGALDGNSTTATSATSATTATTATNAQGLTGTPSITVQDIVAVGATFSGVVTYEDVTNVDSVGVITARTGIKVLAGGANIVGVVTGTNFLKTDGSAVGGEFDITSCLFV